MNRDINEVEREAMKDLTFYFFFGWYGFFFFQMMVKILVSLVLNFFCFVHSVRGSEAQGHLWQEACCWWICKVRFTDCCRDSKCQHKVNGRDSLTAHQSSELFLKFFTQGFMILSEHKLKHSSYIFRVYGASSAVSKNVSRQAAGMRDETLWHSNHIWWVEVLKAQGWLSRVTHNLVQKFKTRRKTQTRTCASRDSGGLYICAYTLSHFLCHSLLYIFHGGLSLFLK